MTMKKLSVTVVLSLISLSVSAFDPYKAAVKANKEVVEAPIDNPDEYEYMKVREMKYTGCGNRLQHDTIFFTYAVLGELGKLGQAAHLLPDPVELYSSMSQYGDKLLSEAKEWSLKAKELQGLADELTNVGGDKTIVNSANIMSSRKRGKAQGYYNSIDENMKAINCINRLKKQMCEQLAHVNGVKEACSGGAGTLLSDDIIK